MAGKEIFLMMCGVVATGALASVLAESYHNLEISWTQDDAAAESVKNALLAKTPEEKDLQLLMATQHEKAADFYEALAIKTGVPAAGGLAAIILGTTGLIFSRTPRPKQRPVRK